MYVTCYFPYSYLILINYRVTDVTRDERDVFFVRDLGPSPFSNSRDVRRKTVLACLEKAVCYFILFIFIYDPRLEKKGFRTKRGFHRKLNCKLNSSLRKTQELLKR